MLIIGWKPLKFSEGAFNTVFFGGGTPGLFAEEYSPLMKCLEPYFTEDVEISIETNPNDLNETFISNLAGVGH